MALSFRFVSAYLGEVQYEVIGDGAPYRVTVRRRAESYERSIFNGGEAEWQRDVVAAIGTLHRHISCDEISPDVVAAFNHWLQAEHAMSIAHMKAHPARYGALSDDDPIVQPPAAVTGAHYVVGTGWVLHHA